jgi:hypothetical protein
MEKNQIGQRTPSDWKIFASMGLRHPPFGECHQTTRGCARVRMCCTIVWRIRCSSRFIAVVV